MENPAKEKDHRKFVEARGTGDKTTKTGQENSSRVFGGV